MCIFNPRQVGAPGGGDPEGNTMERRSQVLVGLLCLTRVITRGQTHRCSEGLAEGFPDLEYKLGTTVGHNVGGDSMEAEHTVYHKVSCF